MCTSDDDNSIVVPDIPSFLTTQQLDMLHEEVNPLAESESFGLDLYLKAKEFVKTCMYI